MRNLEGLTPAALPAAIDPQHLSGDERAERAGKHLDHPRHLVDGGDTVERAGLDQFTLMS